MANGDGNDQRLDSWKEIAAYLRRDERTAVRWEKEKGLPVHRVPGGKRQAVFAYTQELDGWLRQEGGGGTNDRVAASALFEAEGTARETRMSVLETLSPVPALEKKPPFAGRIRINFYVLAFVVTLLVILAAFALRTRRTVVRVPVRLVFTLNAVEVFDAQDQLMWTYTFPGKLDPGCFTTDDMAEGARIADFLGNGEKEVLIAAPLYPILNPGDPPGTEVYLFSSEGRVIWSYYSKETFQFGQHELRGPWLGTALFVSEDEGKKRIWLNLAHATWGNSFVVNLDPETGKEMMRFVNTGTIHALNELRAGEKRYFLAAGFNNEPDSGSLAIVDENRAYGASPQTKGSRHECTSCPSGWPDYYFVFPHSEISDLEGLHEDAIIAVHVSGDQVEVRKAAMGGDLRWAAYYTLRAGSGFRPISLRFSSEYDNQHRKYEAEGKLHHSLEQCPERLHPQPIKMWTPSGGWTEIQLSPTTFNR